MLPSHDNSLQLLAGALLLLTLFSFCLTFFVLHESLDRIASVEISVTNEDVSHHATTRDPYKKLKRDFEARYPPFDQNRIRDYVAKLRKHEIATQADMPYDIHNCPPDPPKNYPFAWNVMDVINHWNPDDTKMPSKIHQGLCVFDWSTDLDKAQRYRAAEVPFIIQNNPDLLQTSERWNRNNAEYLSNLFGEKTYKTEYSKNNHMMYWKAKKKNGAGSLKLPDGWTEPTEIIKLNYGDWLEKAEAMERSRQNHVDQEHWYFRINANYFSTTKSDFMYNELPIFDPSEPSFFMVEPKQQRGINCRFGMKGIIAETHFDQSRNFIALMGGARRYILAHPKQCPNMILYPSGHPSGRHSAVNWSSPDLTKHPDFAKAQVNEVVLQAGDAMYLPTFWFHFIVSLNLNYQCNARSGMTFEWRNEIRACGFG